MAHIFISYSSRQRSLTADFAVVLEAEGYDVWWDRALEAWGDYEEQIREALQDSAAVVVIWSEGAAGSDWVKAEAERARTSRKLVNLRSPEFPLGEIPSPFNRMDHILTLDPDDLAPVLKSVHTVWRGEVPTGVKPRHISYREQYGVDLFSSKRAPMPLDPRDLSPSALLQARYEIVPFVDTSDHRADMLDWCRNIGRYAEEPRATAGRLLHGPGGLGKTRLMIETAQKLRDEGWLAGFMEPPKRPGDEVEAADREQALHQVLAGGDEPGVLMVLELARLARSRPREGVRPVRVVLLARGEVWWQELYRREVEVEILFQRRGHRFGDVDELTQPSPGEARLALFDATIEAYRPLIAEMVGEGIVLPPAEPRQTPARRKRIAEDPGFARPLALQMEALLTLYGAGRDAGGLEVLLEDILGLERRHWSRVIEGLAANPRREEALRRGVAQITVVGGTEKRRQAEDLMAADGHFGARPPADVPWRELQRLYGRPGREGGLGSLEPDLLGEHEAALSGDDRLVDACLAWIAGLPEAEKALRRRALVTVLQRASRPEHGATGEDAAELLRHVIEAAGPALMPDLVAVAAETPGQLADLLHEALPEMAAEAFDVLHTGLPKETVALAEVAETAAGRRVTEARTAAEGEEDEGRTATLARALHERGKRLYSLGRYEEALAATEEAVAHFRELAASRPDAFEPHLAQSLNNLGVWLSNLKQLEAALAATEEALAIRRRLAATRPDAFEPDLVQSLANLGVRFSELGQREAALAATEEAVTICRRLAAAQPEAFEPDLAASLNNLGRWLSGLGRLDAALTASEEAVAIRRRLATARPDAFEPDLARSLSNLGVLLSVLGRREAALAAGEEALAIRRRLAAARPDAFEPDLAESLANFGKSIANLGPPMALQFTEEAVIILRRLAAARPDAFEPDLAWSLNDIGVQRSELGEHEAAMAATEEAVAIRRRLAAAHPDAFEPDLAQSLSDLGIDLSNLGRRAAALAATEEAVAVLRRLAATRPDAFEPELVRSLGKLGVRLLNLGRREAALAATEEGIALLTPHHARQPAAHQEVMDELQEILAKARAASEGKG